MKHHAQRDQPSLLIFWPSMGILECSAFGKKADFPEMGCNPFIQKALAPSSCAILKVSVDSAPASHHWSQRSSNAWLATTPSGKSNKRNESHD